jgi:acyl carrier protein
MEDRLQQVFRIVFDDHSLVITASTTADDIKMWDSLTHLQLITAIEKEYNITFTFDEVMSFGSVGDLSACITEKLSQEL